MRCWQGLRRNPARAGGAGRGDPNSLCSRTLKRQPLIPPGMRPFLTSASSVLANLVFSAEKYLRQEPGTQPYNVSEDSVPEHKIALLKA